MALITLPPGEKLTAPVIPDGVYKTQILNPKVDYAKGSGQPVIQCGLKVLEGTYAGTTIPHKYSLQVEALWRIRDDMRTLGCIDPTRHPTSGSVQIEDSMMAQLLANRVGWADFFTDTQYKNQPQSKLSNAGFLTAEEMEKRGLSALLTGTPAPAAPAPSSAPAPF